MIMADLNGNNLTNDLMDAVRKVLLAGIGGAALTAEKAQGILEEMVTKGELTVEQGKALNQELKHTVKENVDSARAAAAETKSSPAEEAKPSVEDFVKGLSEEDLAKLKELLGKTE
jgi:polyhydroxyalkanoate synthesis regulator phasin